MKNWQLITLLSLIVTIFTIRLSYRAFSSNRESERPFDLSYISNNSFVSSHFLPVFQSLVDVESISLPPPVPEEKCEDKIWCNIPMPNASYFRFDPPIDQKRWELAKIQAAKGEQVLLKRTVAIFPNYLDFLDGDVYFRSLNVPVDIFVDDKRDLSMLKQKLKTGVSTGSPFRRLAEKAEKVKKASSGNLKKNRRLEEEEKFFWEKQGKHVIPPNYNAGSVNRAAVVKLGYFAFVQDGYSQLFQGPKVANVLIGLRTFLDYWKSIRDEIRTPFIAIHGSNENWGLLSTYFPNRTIDWGECCDYIKPDLLEFLNHNMTLMLVSGQHYNFTHPKVISFPRGIPIQHQHVSRMLWDTMRVLLKTSTKNQLVFTASSQWGPRPQIIACVAKKFSEQDFKGLSYNDNQVGRVSPSEYYQRLGTSRLGLALSGLGSDTFRLWEALTLGTVPVLERGMGLDKTLWRLPALLVDDFDDVTPELLRTAYVEALYRADEFEFYRLKQSFWWTLLANVSVTMDTQTFLDKFPLESEDPGFMRPKVPFDCWKTNSCGAGTKRVPKSTC